MGPFDEIGAKFLLSDADLLLAMVQAMSSRRAGESRDIAIRRARAFLRRLCELICLVRMPTSALEELGARLELIQAHLAKLENPEPLQMPPRRRRQLAA